MLDIIYNSVYKWRTLPPIILLLGIQSEEHANF